MTTLVLDAAEDALVAELVRKFESDLALFHNFADQLRVFVDDPVLRSLYHSFRSRVKEPSHLRDKLERKVREAKIRGEPFEITAENLYERINDLAGIRLLHLHTGEFQSINARLHELFDEHLMALLEGPEARVWDREYREVFENMGVATVDSARMYTSVHYVVQANRKTKLTAEIQVRTLAEELWGEVDHAINYPRETELLACREQIRVLARVTSSCTRLVDSIYRTKADAG